MRTVWVELTELEARTLLDAASSIADDIDHYAYSAQQKRAYVRGREKLRTALTPAPGSKQQSEED